MADWDLLLVDARIATMRAGGSAYGLIEQGALAIRDETSYRTNLPTRPAHSTAGVLRPR